jgi:hypothetical protein
MVKQGFASPFENYPEYEYPKAELRSMEHREPRPSGYKIHRKVNSREHGGSRCICNHQNKNAPLGFLSNMALDDIIIIGLIIILLMEELEERDWGTIIALAFLLF